MAPMDTPTELDLRLRMRTNEKRSDQWPDGFEVAGRHIQVEDGVILYLLLAGNL